jgi:hypothetical protein
MLSPHAKMNLFPVDLYTIGIDYLINNISMIKISRNLLASKRRKLPLTYLLLCVLFVFMNSCNNNKSVVKSSSDSSFLISGKVLQTLSYCGGAKPTQEILDRLSTPKAYPDKTFYVRAGSINDINKKTVVKFNSKMDGTFSFNLKPGTYSIIMEEQLLALNTDDYKAKKQAVDEKCLQEWWGKPYYILEVTDKNITDLKFTFDHKCFLRTDVPCITYIGPKPA